MIDPDENIEAEAGAPEAAADGPTPKGRRAFSRMPREMTPEEWANSGVQKILMDELDRLQNENSALSMYTQKYHEVNTENAVLREKAKYKIASDISFGIFTSVGGAAIGYAQNITVPTNAGSVVLLTGIVLMIAGLASKVVLK